MARTEARISVDIWAPESDFSLLSQGEQVLYFFLISQPDLAHDGVIALRERRWAKSIGSMSTDEIAKNLTGLEMARYIVLDDDTEEVLVRSLIRRDKIFRQPNVLRAAADHVALVMSPTIRAAIAEELRRVQTLDMPKDSAPIITRMLEDIGEPLARTNTKASEKGSGEPFGKASAGTPGERGRVKSDKNQDHSPFPESQSENLSSSDEPTRDENDFALINESEVVPAHPHLAPKRAWTTEQIYVDPHFMDFWKAFPLKVDKPEAATAWLRHVRNGVDPTAITAGAARYRDDPERSREKRYIKHPPGWLNNAKWADAESATPPPAPKSTYWGDN